MGKVGENPIEGISSADYSVEYHPPNFYSKWDIYIYSRNFKHILGHNHERLVSVLDEETANNSHCLFRTIYGEIMLEQKEAAGVIPQWYVNSYYFLMTISLTGPNKVDLTAALTIDETMGAIST